MTYERMTQEDAMAERVSRVQQKGQVTIPADIRRRLGLETGDMVAFVETDQGVLITPQEVVASDALRRLGEALRERGITPEELMASGRKIRGELVEELYGLSDEE